MELTNATDVMELLVVDALKSIAKRAGISKTIRRKGELIEALNHFIETDPARFVQELAPTERSFLAEAVHNNNRVSPVMFSAKYQVECPRPSRSYKSASLLDMVIASESRSKDFYVPETVADRLRPLLEKPESPTPATIAVVPDLYDPGSRGGGLDRMQERPIHIHRGEQTAFLELRRTLKLVQAGKVRIQPKICRPTTATERVLAASLAEPDFDLELPEQDAASYSLKSGPVRAHAWAVLVQQCGWCQASGETLKLTRDGELLLQQTSPEAFREGIERFGSDNDFDELRRVNNIKGQTGKARRWMSQPSERREKILAALAEWPVNEWMDFEEAYRFLKACGHKFAVAAYSSILYLGEQHYGEIYDDAGLNRQYLRVLLFESLATLGLIDVAYVYPHFLWPELGGGGATGELDFCGRYDGLLYVRLNPLGAYCLGHTDDYAPPAAERRALFVVLANREIAVTDHTQLRQGDIAMLELFARKEGDHLWRMDKPRILDFLEAGGSLDEISGFLSDNSTQEIPVLIRGWFNDLQAKTRMIVNLDEAWLVEFQEASAAALVACDSKAGRLCVLAGERHVAVTKANERAFRTAIKKLGYVLPR